MFDASDVERNKAMAVLSYLGILVLVPIFAVQDSPYTRFHANQGLVLLIFEVAAAIVITILQWILILAVWYVGAVIGTILWIAFSVIIVILVILGIVAACKGEAKELPIIGKIKILK